MDIIKRIPFVLFSLQAIKSFTISPSIQDVALLVVFAIFSAFYEVQIQNKKLAAHKEEMKKLVNEIKDVNSKFENLSTKVDGLKMGQLRAANVR